MMHYIISELDMASGSWHTFEWQKLGDSEKQSIAAFLGTRRWPLMVAATGELTNEAMASLAAVVDREHYDGLPPNDKTVETRALISSS